MTSVHRARRREKLSANVDADLLAAVDRFVADHPDATRSSVIDDALRGWARQQRAHAIAEQYDGGTGVPPDEWSSWVGIRDAVAADMVRKSR